MKTQEQEKARGQRGQALAEFALILPILLIVVFGIIDFGRVLFVFADASGKLRDAARYAAVLGLSNDTTPEYVNCTDIRNTALTTLFVSSEVVEIYYWDTSDPADSGLTPLNPNPTPAYANHAAYLATAHYTCFGTGGIATVSTSGSELENGDILRVHYTGRINFITPFLSAIWTGIDLDFFAQRSIIDQLTLGSTEGIDYDFDGLDDRWEFMWYGCYDENEELWTVDEEWLYADLSTWQEWTLSHPTLGSNRRWYDPALEDDEQLCDGIRWVTNPDDPALADVPIPLANNLEETNAIRDFDNDGCSAGCEENRNSNPNDVDADGDGLNDGQEATVYFTNPTGGDFYYCHENQRFETPDIAPANGVPDGDGVPDGYDSDCDGVPDGVEVGVFEPNNPNLHYDGAPAAEIGYPYRPSYAFITDTDVDGYFDSVDSDGDGLYEYEEYYGADACSGPEAAGRPTQAIPYDCHPDLDARYREGGATPISFPTNEYLTSSTYYDDVAPTGPDGYDTDNDGLSDKEEIDGWNAGSFEINRVMQYNVLYSSHPNYADSDRNPNLGDGDDQSLDVDDIPTLDIDEKTYPINTTDGGVGFTDPMDGDTDGDGLSDWIELNEYGSNPLDDDSDFDGLSDGSELPDSNPGNPNSDGTPMTGYDYDGNGLPDAGFEVDSAGEIYPSNHVKDFSIIAGHTYSGNPAYASVTLPGEVLITADACKYMNDGYEINFLGTDPGELDSDNDGLSDCYEVDSNLNPNNPDGDGDGLLDGIDCDPRNSSSVTIVQGCNTTDTDNDGMDDAWEIANLGGGNPEDHSPTADYDDDGCNNLCEYQRGTDTSPYDLINCGLVDGTNNRYADTDPLRNGQDFVPDGWDTDCDGIYDNDELPDSSPTDHDTDDDGLIDGFEMNYSYDGINPSPLNPRSGNSDGDDISDYNEALSPLYNTVCANGLRPNPTLADTDGDGVADHLEVNPTATAYDAIFPATYPAAFRAAGTDPCNPNTDGDGWSDSEEIFTYTGANPRNIDTDGDGIQDDVENDVTGTTYTIFDTYACDENGIVTGSTDGVADGYDTDCDGLRDGIEVYDTRYADIVGGGALDGFRMDIYICGSLSQNDILISTLSPGNFDTDGDGLSDGAEWNPEANGGAGAGVGTNPTLANTDNDLQTDGAEHNDGDSDTDPLCSDGGAADNDDRDGDTLPNDEEITGYDLGGLWGVVVTNPDDDDSDGDLIPDNEELAGRAFTYTYIDTAGNPQTVVYDVDPNTAGILPLITNPTHIDSPDDSDNEDDGWDSDRDGLNDLEEFNGAAVYDVDCDGDGIADSGITFPMYTNPADTDTDGDGMPDGVEIENNTNPLDGTCGPAIIFNKMGPRLETAVNMFWQVPGSGTEAMSALEAEEAALGYLVDWYTTIPADREIYVTFVSTGRCNVTNITPIITAAGATNVSGEPNGNPNPCPVDAEVTFDELITILFDPAIGAVWHTWTDNQQ